MNRPKRTGTVDVRAECQDLACRWRTEGKGSIGRAAQHFDRTGHRTIFHSTLVGEYGSTSVSTDAVDLLDPDQESLL